MSRPRGDEQAAQRDLVWVCGACAVSLVLGLAFVFVRAPHPWGWQGFDHYDDLGRALARGEPYPTLDRTWGYPLFLSLCYRIFAGRVWPALLIQVALNSVVPALVYQTIRRRVDRRVAVAAAVLVGCCSFNTVYASTQSSDALCTVATVAGVVLMARLGEGAGAWTGIVAGLLLGCAGQLRPNMLLLPPVLAAALLWRRRVPFGVAALVCLAAAAVDAPWIARNFRVSGTFIPTTTRSGVQLWYGTVQVPPYFSNWTLNPRRAFEPAFFDYSPPGPGPMSIRVQRKECATAALDRVVLYYRAGRHGPFSAADAVRHDAQQATFAIPRGPLGSAVYYYFDAEWRRGSGTLRQMTPLPGPAAPLVRFSAADDLHDLDADDDLLDAYDVVKLLRHDAWREPFPNSARLDLDHDGAITEHDLDIAMSTLSRPSAWNEAAPEARRVVRSVNVGQTSVTAILQDGSSLTAPKQWSGAITDVTIDGPMAGDVMRSRRSLDRLAWSGSPDADGCLELLTVADDDFFVREPQADARYRSLAIANVRQTPVAFAAACARRFFELFIVSGPGAEAGGPPQVTAPGQMYRIARVVTLALFIFTLAGLWIAWRRGLSLLLIWLPIAYIPLTLCYMTTNMRYTVAIQPFQFVFIAIAADALWTIAARTSSKPSSRQVGMSAPR